MRKKITVQTVYFKDDKDFNTDYHSVRILQDGELIQEYQDSYHDKGTEKAEGFVDALKLVGKNKYEFHYENIHHEEDTYN